MSRRARAIDRGVRWLCAGAALIPIAVVAILLLDAARRALGAPTLDQVGVGMVHSLKLGVLTAVIAVPVGVGVALYLEEYGARRAWARLVEWTVDGLAGVPPVVYGLVGFVLFARLGPDSLPAALTLALVILPIIVERTREALRAIPPGQREAGLALGATRWQVARQIVLPLALPGIVAGILFAIVRAIGEAAPLLVLGGLAWTELGGPPPIVALPVKIFDWVDTGEPARAAGGILVLALVLLALSGLATLAQARAARIAREVGA